jgi:two-component system sensor histidine kinase HydH
MTPSHLVGLAACVGQLVVALLCVVRTTRSPLAFPLAILCLDIFGWTGAGLAFEVSGAASWRWVDHALTPWTAPLALLFVLTFAGRERELRPTLVITSVASSGLSAASVAAFATTAVQPFIGSVPWSLALMAVALPTMVFAMLVLGRHLAESHDPAERTRARLLLAALAIGTVLGATEELGRFLGVPALGGVGMLVTSVLLAVVALRFRLFDRDEPLRAVGYALALAGASTVAALVVFRFLGAHVALFVLGSATVTLALVAASRRWLAEGAERRARRDQLATLGRFTAQMAHDLKNPLAALKGAAQLLREDIPLASPKVDRLRFADLMLEQIERLNELVDVYGRLARIEPNLEPRDVNASLRAVLSLQSLASDAVTVRTDLAAELPPCMVDDALLARVLENLIRNATEAMPGGGTVVVRTRVGDGREPGVEVSVEDTGSGMDARTRERAFDDFFTTKSQGSGLGLAFVRRAVEAHGGRVNLTSEPARGTVVRLWLPCPSRPDRFS